MYNILIFNRIHGITQSLEVEGHEVISINCFSLLLTDWNSINPHSKKPGRNREGGRQFKRRNTKKRTLGPVGGRDNAEKNEFLLWRRGKKFVTRSSCENLKFRLLEHDDMILIL